MKEWGITTKALHTGLNLEAGSSSVPIYQTAAYAYDDAETLANVFEGKDFGYIYSRISNPTVTSFEQKINALENGVGAIATSSGMSAISSVIFSLTKTGDEIISSKSLFGGTYEFFNKVLKKYGVKIKYVDTCDVSAYRKALTDKTKLIFLESIGNPGLDVPDIKKISDIANENNIPLVLDSTFTPPYLFSAKEYGVSIVIHSATKYLTGNGTTIGGVIVDTGNFNWKEYKSDEFLAESKKIHRRFIFLALTRRIIHQNVGVCMSPFNAFMHNLGLETLALRMKRHCENALKLAEFFNDYSKIKTINYLGLKDNKYHLIAEKLFNGKYSGMITIELESKEKCYELINELKLVKNMTNLGDAKTLIIHPASTIYHEFSKDELEEAGVNDRLIRISVGIEDIEDIIEDFRQALEKI